MNVPMNAVPSFTPRAGGRGTSPDGVEHPTDTSRKEATMSLLTKTNTLTELDAYAGRHAKQDVLSHEQFAAVTTGLRSICAALDESAPLLAEIDDIEDRFKNDQSISKVRFYDWYIDLRSMVKTLSR